MATDAHKHVFTQACSAQNCVSMAVAFSSVFDLKLSVPELSTSEGSSAVVTSAFQNFSTTGSAS